MNKTNNALTMKQDIATEIRLKKAKETTETVYRPEQCLQTSSNLPTPSMAIARAQKSNSHEANCLRMRRTDSNDTAAAEL